MALGGVLVISSGSAFTSASPRSVTVHRASDGVSARFLSEARAAFLGSFHDGHPGMLLAHGGPADSVRSTALDSYNWSGYADTSTTTGAFSKVIGSWAVPAVTCTAEDTLDSNWVGLDGATDTTVEQDGTTSQCFESKTVYYSWYEMYPAGTVVISQTAVKAGDKITGSVVRTTTSYKLTLTDATHSAGSGSATATCAASTCKDLSAEWIVERPDYSTTGITPLADYKTVAFSADSKTSTGTITTDSFTMIDSTQTYALTTVAGSAAAFTATWKDSY